MLAPIVAYWEGLPAWITDGLTVLAALLLGIGIWWLWWRLPKREADRLALKIRDAKARADVEDNYRKTVGQALGGVAVLLGTGTAYLQFSQQQQASHDLLISNQVSKGFEQLGSNVIVVRLGGIYALEGVMNNSDQYHQAVLEALSAFVREGAKQRPTEPPTAEQPTPLPTTPLPTDIQAALTVIGRRVAGEGAVALSGADLSGANLTRARMLGADLASADLRSANLSGANLIRADLLDANLISANLRDANLSGAQLPYADLAYANLSGAHLSDARLIDANLTGAP
jgi:pentapeptide repeat protein